MKKMNLNEKRKHIDGTYNSEGFEHRGEFISRSAICSRFGTTDISNKDLQIYLNELRKED